MARYQYKLWDEMVIFTIHLPEDLSVLVHEWPVCASQLLNHSQAMSGGVENKPGQNPTLRHQVAGGRQIVDSGLSQVRISGIWGSGTRL